ncbi:MAG: hypothetical protein H6551_10425 [Chitinophagales bacterium]|nr:hypothetical protein [Chitinophagaceae bacterium]MCB9065543.1 hypothetical protein [Chitinophagales bacterium]
MNYRQSLFLLIIVLGIAAVTGCKKEQLLVSGGELRFSVDTLLFDTVFTGRGNFTTSVKIYNPQSQKVNISSIRLKKNPDDCFTININGQASDAVTDVELAANDSMYVFATVNIDPNDSLMPFIRRDDLVATLNGKEYSIPFIAYGQNAYYLIDSVIEDDQTWKTDKPYVIMHNALVGENKTLTIPAGCKVYVHGDSRLYVAGTLKVNGTKGDSVVFQGDRLDRKYFGNEGYPGEWGGMYFTGTSKNNEMNYAVLKNCGGSTKLGSQKLTPAAIQLNQQDVFDGTPQLIIRNSIIENSIGYGIVAFTSSLYAENCLINTCGAQCLAVVRGGGYLIKNCTFATYGTDKVSHIDEPSMAVLNYIDLGNNDIEVASLRFRMINSVVWGGLETEFLAQGLGDIDNNPDLFDVQLNNCLFKAKDGVPERVKAIDCILNEDPLFEDPGGFNFRLKGNSPAVNSGRKPPYDNAEQTPPANDLDGKPRDPNSVDMGCYEN